MSDEPELRLEDVRYLLPPDLLNELFGESITPQHGENQPTNGVFIVQATTSNSNHHQLSNQPVPVCQGVEENVPSFPMERRYTWAQIVKGDHTDHESLVGTRASFPPLTSTVRCEKAEGEKSNEDQKANSSGNGTMRK